MLSLLNDTCFPWVPSACRKILLSPQLSCRQVSPEAGGLGQLLLLTQFLLH